jgi:hypothetical protein
MSATPVPPFPAWAPDQLLPAMRAYLRTNGLVRLPAETGPNASLPTMWLDPKRGVPYPGQTENLGANETDDELVTAAFPATGIPSAPFEGFIVRLNATIWYRALRAPLITSMHEQVRTLLHDKRNYSMNGLLVNESLFFRELQRISADERGYNYNCEVAFTMWSTDYEF